jgi:DAK2 domain fusion protein YloV
VTEHATVLALARAAEASLEANRARLDDLNVYPVPDGDTGTNMLLTARAVVEALESSEGGDRAELAEAVAHAALLGARGNSGVILSQIVRGAADVLGAAEEIDAATVARAVAAASDAAYRAVREPAEGTMLTVIREVAAEADARAADAALPELVAALVAYGDEAVARTREQLDVLREAGVVDAGGAGLVDVLRGLAAHLCGGALPEAPAAKPLSAEAIHLEVSRYRYCTVYVVEGERLDSHALEEALVPLGDSLLVVGDERALKVHVHTNDPGAALRAGTALGVLERVEIANMQVQTAQREERLSVSDQALERTTEVVAVVTGEGNRRLFESLGAAALVEGGETMNPSTEELLDGIERTSALEAVVLANNPNVVLAAQQAARLAGKPVQVVDSGSLPAGLAAMIAFDGGRSAEDNAGEMAAVLADVATGAVTIASRRVSVNGLEVAKGAYLGLVGDEPVAGGTSFDPVAASVVERLLAEPRDVLTLLTGADEPELGALLARLAERHPEIELEVHPGGQPHYPLLLSAE